MSLLTSLAIVSKLVQERPSVQKEVKLALAGLTEAQQAYVSSHSAASAAVLRDLEQAREQGEKDHSRAEALSAEFVRLRRMMAEHTAAGI